MNPANGERIRTLRKALDMRQDEFAALFPVSYVTVSRWENGLRDPTPISWRKIEQLEREVAAKQTA